MTPDAPRPWWESEIGQFAPPQGDRPDGADVLDVTETAAPTPRPLVTPAPPGRARSGPLSERITTRGLLLVMAAPTVVLCLIGFIVSGATSIPALAGLGLIVGSAAAAVIAPPRLGWLPVAFPPLVMLAVIVVLGQITLIGSRPTLVRELAMIVSQLTATAPAQVAAVVLMGAVLYLRRRLSSR